MDSLTAKETLDTKTYHALGPVGDVGVVSTTVRSIKTSQAKLYGWVVHNPNGAVSWLQVFDRPSTQVMLGTTPPALTVKVGADGSVVQEQVNPVNMSAGLSIAATTTETGSTAPTTGLSVSVLYK